MATLFHYFSDKMLFGDAEKVKTRDGKRLSKLVARVKIPVRIMQEWVERNERCSWLSQVGAAGLGQVESGSRTDGCVRSDSSADAMVRSRS